MRENILKIESDPTHRIIRVNNKEYEKPFFLRHYTEIPDIFDIKVGGHTFINKKNGKKQGNKEYNHSLSEALGMPPSLWKRRFNYEMIALWVEPVKQFSYLFRGFRGRINYHDLLETWDRKEYLMQAIEDGQENLIPLIFAFNATPSELKAMFGKGEWKRLCKNSRTRNMLIVKCAPFYRLNEADRVRNVKYANKIPSTVLGYRNDVGDSLLWAVKNKERALNIDWETGILVSLYADTKRMAQRTRQEFNPNWSRRTMKEKHEEFTNKINEARYGTKPFEYERIIIEQGEYTGELLMSPKEVANEGTSMRHCVASYAEDCSFGKYAVFSIKKNDDRYSTLGLRKRDTEWRINQHYMACNQRVKDSAAMDLAQQLCNKMNEVNT